MYACPAQENFARVNATSRKDYLSKLINSSPDSTGILKEKTWKVAVKMSQLEVPKELLIRSKINFYTIVCMHTNYA